MNLISNIWNHPRTSTAGLKLIAAITIAGVLSRQGVTLGNAGTGTVNTLIGGVATALLGLLAKDPDPGPATGSCWPNSALLMLAAPSSSPARCLLRAALP